MIMVSPITVSLISYRFVLFDCFIPLFHVFVRTVVMMGTSIKRYARVKSQLSRFKFDSGLILFFSLFDLFQKWLLFYRVAYLSSQIDFSSSTVCFSIQTPALKIAGLGFRRQRSLTWPSLKQNSWFKYSAIIIIVLCLCTLSVMRSWQYASVKNNDNMKSYPQASPEFRRFQKVKHWPVACHLLRTRRNPLGNQSVSTGVPNSRLDQIWIIHFFSARKRP